MTPEILYQGDNMSHAMQAILDDAAKVTAPCALILSDSDRSAIWRWVALARARKSSYQTPEETLRAVNQQVRFLCTLADLPDAHYSAVLDAREQVIRVFKE